MILDDNLVEIISLYKPDLYFNSRSFSWITFIRTRVTERSMDKHVKNINVKILIVIIWHAN